MSKECENEDKCKKVVKRREGRREEREEREKEIRVEQSGMKGNVPLTCQS